MIDFTNEFAGVSPAFDPADPCDGIYYDVPNEVYHSAVSAISNSMLAMINRSVSAYQWMQGAPVNKDKLKAFELGTALHAAVLEPKRFRDEYVLMPPFNMRTNKGKQDSLDFAKANSDRFIISDSDARHIQLMRDSIMADPRLSLWLSMDGKPEAVVVVTDKVTGLKLRIRCDWLVDAGDVVVCLDLKSTDSMDKFRRDFFDLRYDVQDAFYTNVLEQHFGKPVLFLFGVVSKSVDCGRYPVACERLDDADRAIANEIYRADLNKLSNAIESNDWVEYTSMRRTERQREYMYEQLK